MKFCHHAYMVAKIHAFTCNSSYGFSNAPNPRCNFRLQVKHLRSYDLSNLEVWKGYCIRPLFTDLLGRIFQNI